MGPNGGERPLSPPTSTNEDPKAGSDSFGGEARDYGKPVWSIRKGCWELEPPARGGTLVTPSDQHRSESANGLPLSWNQQGGNGTPPSFAGHDTLNALRVGRRLPALVKKARQSFDFVSDATWALQRTLLGIPVWEQLSPFHEFDESVQPAPVTRLLPGSVTTGPSDPTARDAVDHDEWRDGTAGDDAVQALIAEAFDVFAEFCRAVSHLLRTWKRLQEVEAKLKRRFPLQSQRVEAAASRIVCPVCNREAKSLRPAVGTEDDLLCVDRCYEKHHRWQSKAANREKPFGEWVALRRENVRESA